MCLLCPDEDDTSYHDRSSWNQEAEMAAEDAAYDEAYTAAGGD